jgi:hypothetical protein
MDKAQAVEKLNRQIEQIESLKKQKSHGQQFKKWHRDTEVAIEKIFGPESRHLTDFNEINYSLMVCTSSTPDYEWERAYQNGLDTAKTVLSSFIDEISEYWIDQPDVKKYEEPLEIIRKLCARFHKVARQLRSRYRNRSTILIEDEYDVQDLFHALLKLYFDDIRNEEWTPSYAGASSRIDFLLKQEEVIVEIKKTRKGLEAKELGDQLLVDIQRYKAHPSCGTLVCFVYDPEGRIGNPSGIENDLNREIDGTKVRVFIGPRDM